ncbi:MAG: phenylpropionate dioxygenase-like ring-hydroxylating dioxygenase large terminal subunit, partial [Maribacter sp.]
MRKKHKIFPKKLFSCWHPVGYSYEIKADKPYGTFLLDEPVVVWRTADGNVHAMRDVCIHRGTALSLGWIKDDCLVCPYHAWQFDKKGDCVLIPQAPEAEIPSKAKTPTYHCQEKFGLVWVALEDPVYDLPTVPEYENTAWKLVKTGPFDWKSDSSRQVENFTDFGHFPWVHPGLLGDPERPKVPECRVIVKDSVLHYSVVR